MLRQTIAAVFVGGLAGILAGCGGGGGGWSPPPSGPVSYVAPTSVFVAWANPADNTYNNAPVGSYAGMRQSQRGNVDYLSGQALPVNAGVEVYKSSDGHIYALDLAPSGPPEAQQLSAESSATVDDTCSLSGTSVPGANYDYVGVYYAADLQNPTNSTYIYRLPGPSGVCDTAGDLFHMVKTGMLATDAPVAVSGMPVATVHTAQGGIAGFVLKSGNNLVLTDGQLANPVPLGTFATPINVAVALPLGTTQGYPSGQLYVIDGNIVYVDYVADTVSAPLYTIPNWSPTNPAALFAASPSTLYFSIYTPAAGATPANSTIYAMPADGSAPPSAIDSELGRVTGLTYPIDGSNLIWGVVNGTYAIRAIPAAGGAVTTLESGTGNGGLFIATANTVYYEYWNSTTNVATLTVTRSGTSAGVVGIDGTVIQSATTGVTFVNGGEQEPWPNDPTVTSTPYVTVFEVSGLSTVSVYDPASGYTYVEDAVSGGTLVPIDTASNTAGPAIGILPQSSAMFMNGTFRDSADVGFLQTSNVLSTEDPATRDLYLFGTQSAGSLTRVTNNL